MSTENGSNGGHDVAKIIAELDERGYCVIPSVIPVEKADRVRTILERILADEADEVSRERRTPAGGPDSGQAPRSSSIC